MRKSKEKTKWEETAGREETMRGKSTEQKWSTVKKETEKW